MKTVRDVKRKWERFEERESRRVVTTEKVGEM